jgi:microcystin-dependent protein
VATPYIGEIKMFAGTYAIQGWAFCDGSLLPISQYDALFSLFGTMYGGDGVQTFGVPDLRGRIPLHVGGGMTQGQLAGTETVTLTNQQMPSHSHLVNTSATGGDTGPAYHVLATSTDGTPMYLATNNNPGTLVGASISAAGQNQSHDNMMPFLAITFLVALEGVYPTPN